MEIQWAETPNKWIGRNGKKPLAIVDHITAGNFPGCLNWMQNPDSKAGAHYLVTRDGQIFQMAKDEDSPYHAGIVAYPSWALYDGSNPNRYTIGIEHEGFDGELTEPQYQATLWLHGLLINKWGIPIDDEHIIGHYRIDSVNRPNCPGPNFPWERLFADLRGGNIVPEWMQKIMAEARAIGLITQDHNPQDTAQKWFVLAVALSVIRIVRGGK